MILNRRTVLKTGAAASAVAVLPALAQAGFAPRPEGWRRFELVMRIELPAGAGSAQAWVPVPSIDAAGWMRSGEATWSGTADQVSLEADPVYGARFVHAVWDAASQARALEVSVTASTQSRATDLTRPGDVPDLSPEDRALYTAPTALIPTDGLVLATADDITAGATTDLEKARLIYDWIVENTARNPATRGCGLGDVGSMLATGDLSGKCADLNALYVGLARAAGLPARDVYGLRVAPSAFGYKSLGAGSEIVTKAQHCRAEVHLAGFGWIAVDPADVRKVMLEEPPGHLAIDDPKVADARAALFGGWEGNWVGLNFAHDVKLPGSSFDPVGFLMYPQAELNGVEQDALDPDNFAYSITVRELG